MHNDKTQSRNSQDDYTFKCGPSDDEISEKRMREMDLYEAYGEEYDDNQFDWL